MPVISTRIVGNTLCCIFFCIFRSSEFRQRLRWFAGALNFFLRALDFAFFECFYFMKAIPFSMNFENRIAAPSRSSGGKRLSIWFGRPKPRAHKYGRQPYARWSARGNNDTSVIRGPAIMKAGKPIWFVMLRPQRVELSPGAGAERNNRHHRNSCLARKVLSSGFPRFFFIKLIWRFCIRNSRYLDKSFQKYSLFLPVGFVFC